MTKELNEILVTNKQRD